MDVPREREREKDGASQDACSCGATPQQRISKTEKGARRKGETEEKQAKIFSPQRFPREISLDFHSSSTKKSHDSLQTTAGNGVIFGSESEC